MTNWANPGPPAQRTEASANAMAYIRSLLAESGHRVHSPSYWEDRGIKVSRLPDGQAVTWCVWCYQAARRGGLGNGDAQVEGWQTRGFQSVCEEAAGEHFQNVHAGAVGMA